MKTMSVALKAHLALEVTTIATCWQVKRVDGTVTGYTDHDRDMVITDSSLPGTGATTYKAATGLIPSSGRTASDGSVDASTAYGLLDSDGITDADLEAGLYDYAAITQFIVNFADLSMGICIMNSGHIGQVTRHRNAFQGEVRSKSQALQQPVGRVVSAACDADLGDSRCTINLASYTVSDTVTAFTSRNSFTASGLTQGTDYFTGGLLTWTGGANDGLKMEVKSFTSGGLIVLTQSMPYAIANGDTFSVYKGCNKVPGDATNGCTSFSNIINFQGFPFVPGIDQMIKYPNAH